MANVYNKPIVVVSRGGSETTVDNGMIYENKYRVRYFDIDGTILKIEYVAEGGKLTPPTKTPNYDPDYLIFDEWNYDIENYVVEQPTDVGATYKTVDDATYLFCRFTTATGLNPTINFTGISSVDWGDGTVDNFSSTTHTYEKEGNYIIKIKGSIVFPSSYSTPFRILGSDTLNGALEKIYIRKNLNKNQYPVIGYQCTNLKVVSFTKIDGVSYIYGNCFRYTFNLKCFIVPKGYTDLASNSFSNSGIEHFIAPQGFTEFGKSAFNYANALKDIVMPPTVIELGGTYCFDNNSSLSEIWIPKSMKRIEEYNFGGATYMFTPINIFIASTTLLTLGTQCFRNLTDYNKGTIFWINDAKIEDLKVAANWSTYADRMKPLSWYPSLTYPNA